MIRISAKLQTVIVPTTGLGQADLAEISRSAALGVRQQVVDHFMGMKEATKSRYWWHGAIKSIGQPEVEGCTATISIGQKGVRLQWLGGTVLPSGRTSRVTGRPIQSLLVPFSDSPLRRKSLDELGIPDDEIVVLPSQTGKAPVMYWVHERKRKGKDGLKHKIVPLACLLRSATIKPKPQVMPTDAEMTDAARSAVVSYTRAINHRNTLQP